MSDSALRQRLGAAGIQTAAEYAWTRRLDALERFLLDMARPRQIPASTADVATILRAPAG